MVNQGSSELCLHFGAEDDYVLYCRASIWWKRCLNVGFVIQMKEESVFHMEDRDVGFFYLFDG